MDRPNNELSHETQRRVDAIMAEARAEAESRRPGSYLATVFGALTGIVSLIAVMLVWAQEPSIRSPYLFLVAGLPFFMYLAVRRGFKQQPGGVYRIDMLPVWLTIEAIIGVVFFFAVILIVCSMLIETAFPRVSELLMRFALLGGSCTIGGLFVFFFASAWRLRVVVDDAELREHRLMRTVGATWGDIGSIEVEPAADGLSGAFLWPASALYRVVIGRLRHRGMLKGETWSIRRIKLHDGGSFALRVQGLMEPQVSARMTEEILRRAQAAAIPLVDRSGMPVQPDPR